MKKTLPLIFISVTFLLGCGKDGSSNKSSNLVSSNPALEEQTAQGQYRALLRPLNGELSGFIPSGVAEIKIVGDNVQVKTLLDDDASVIHMQNVHLGTTCPRVEEHDFNGDGLVDIKEAQRASGNVYMPLDGDLNSFDAGSSVFPLGGNYTYIENASLHLIQDDAKARGHESLNFAGRVVLIYGVDGATFMPDTVATVGEMSRQASIPIACGILRRELFDGE